jgi:putative DNA primase/helicase
MWQNKKDWANPQRVLASAHQRRDVVEGLVPDRGVTWLYGASMSFKTFVAMSIAAAASCGSDWMGLKTEKCLVVYVGAEGGMSLHVRRAGAEMAAGQYGDLCVATERPLLDTPMGQARLRGMLEGLLPGTFGEEEDVSFQAAMRAYTPDEVNYADCAVLVVLDTYSQTSSGDDKVNVSAYIKGLRDMIEDAAGGCIRLAFLVIDHATKTGGSYMGSVAKLNDVDSQIEVTRSGASYVTTLHQRKTKDGVESAPISVELTPQTLGEYVDAYGKPIVTLVARDGSKALRIAEVADGKAGVILALLEDEGGRCDDETLRKLFAAHKSNEGIKQESVARAYKRGKENLQEADVIAVDGGVVRVL